MTDDLVEKGHTITNQKDNLFSYLSLVNLRGDEAWTLQLRYAGLQILIKNPCSFGLGQVTRGIAVRPNEANTPCTRPTFPLVLQIIH